MYWMGFKGFDVIRYNLSLATLANFTLQSVKKTLSKSKTQSPINILIQIQPNNI